jgi:hypothetical protein
MVYRQERRFCLTTAGTLESSIRLEHSLLQFPSFLAILFADRQPVVLPFLFFLIQTRRTTTIASLPVYRFLTTLAALTGSNAFLTTFLLSSIGGTQA